ncbi:phospholipid/cholesterol/gamma-HCH transport system substrate-binding protein [Nocardioides scoriae]|uniref:Phospholipid/cholesterol/gamma-HCH transport system substrate-binding protein n=1 Tax=Nocardioides scoriae TaxID=642780 RepID=A0A1H1TF05_9ACTN|nr:MCE family protein [Nocardioides scoriae]SDS58780.1 phospholipid/cholesterol/gamma-HCH transport system substrate-binding protein [Nocardioides scoriae]
MSVPFRERNPVVIGAISIAVLAALLLGAFKAGSLPLIGGGDTYRAAFNDASGLKPGDEVRIAGVRVGKVDAIELDGNQVVAKFKVDTPSKFGRETGAQIKIKTLLGDMYLALEPEGSGQLAEDALIPRSRTQSAFDVVSAFEGLAGKAEDIDVDQLGKSFDTLAELTDNTPAAFQGTLRGLSRLSETVASRNDQIGELLRNLDTVSGTLANRDEDLVSLMKDSDVLLRALVARREAVHTLLVSTNRLSLELTALVRQTRSDLKPALDNLKGVVDTLLKNQNNLDESLRLLEPFYRVFANTLGSGPWFDVYIENLPPAPALPTGGQG